MRLQLACMLYTAMPACMLHGETAACLQQCLVQAPPLLLSSAAPGPSLAGCCPPPVLEAGLQALAAAPAGLK